MIMCMFASRPAKSPRIAYGDLKLFATNGDVDRGVFILRRSDDLVDAALVLKLVNPPFRLANLNLVFPIVDLCTCAATVATDLDRVCLTVNFG